MAQGSVYQGAWQAQCYQGAWQQQAQASSGTITDSMTATDVLTVEAGVPLSDSMSGAETLILDAAVSLADSMGSAASIPENQVAASQDDCERGYGTSGGFWLTSIVQAGWYSAAYAQWSSGFRFQAVPIPQGATILSATLELCGYSNLSTTVVRTRIRGEDVDDAAAFSNQANWDTRFPGNVTAAQVDWDGIGAWAADSWYTSPDISAVIQEIVDRGGWVTGNDLVIFWDDYDDRSDHNTNTRRQAYGFDINSAKAAKLNVSYRGGSIDTLILDAAVVIQDTMTGVDLLTGILGGQVNLSDSMTAVDSVVLVAEKILSDGMTGVDVLTGFIGGAVLITDSMTAAEQITADAEKVLADLMSGIDSLSGVLGPGIVTPGAGFVVKTPVASRRKQPSQGVKSVNSQPTPLTAVATSSSTTTFTATSVTDGNAWDVSSVEPGDVVVVADEHMGFVTGTGSNRVNVEGWIYRGIDRRGKDPDRPDNGQGVTVHKRLEARQVLICSVDTNTNPIYVGFDENVTPVTGHPVSQNSGQPNASLDLEAPAGKLLNLTQIWVVSGMLQTLKWQTDTLHQDCDSPPSGSVSNIQSLTLSDAMTAVEEIAVKHAEIHLADEMTGIDQLGIDQPVITLSDEMTPVDELTAEAEIYPDGSKLTDAMTGSDQLAVHAEIVPDGSKLTDQMTGVDVLGGVLTPGEGPRLQVVPIYLDYFNNLVTINVTITNIGTGTLNWSLSGVPAWVTPAKSSGSLGAGIGEVVAFGASRAGIPSGRTIDTFDVLSNGGNQGMTADIVKIYSMTCAGIAAMATAPISEQVQPLSGSNGEADFDNSATDLGVIRTLRGGWDVDLTGADQTKMCVIAVDLKNWLGFVSGSPWSLTEQTTFQLLVNGNLIRTMNRGDIYMCQFAYNRSTTLWQQVHGLSLYCTNIAAGSLITPTVPHIQGHWTVGNNRFADRGSVTSPHSDLQDGPYRDEDARAAVFTDDWEPLHDYEFAAGLPVAKSPAMKHPVGGLVPPRTYVNASGIRPLYHDDEPPPGQQHDFWAEQVNSIQDYWDNLPGVTFTDGNVSITLAQGTNYSYMGRYLDANILEFATAEGGSMAWLEGGGHELDLLGGDQDQVVEIQISANPAIKWLRIGLDSTYDELRPNGYFIFDWVGYLEGISGNVPGADWHGNTYYYKAPIFWFGGGIYDPRGSSGCVAKYPLLTSRLIFRRTVRPGNGQCWYLEYGDNCFFINAGKTDILTVTYP